MIIVGSISVDGFGELQFASDDIYRGNWKDGVRHGKVGTINGLVKGRHYTVFVCIGTDCLLQW